MPPLAPLSLGLGKGHGTNMKSKKSQPPPSLGAARDARTHASRAGAGCEGDLRLPHAREARRGHLARAWHARKLAGEARSTSNKGRSAAQSWRHAPRGQRPPGVRAARRGAASRTSVALLSRRSVAGAGSSAARAPPLAKWLPWIRHFQNSGASNVGQHDSTRWELRGGLLFVWNLLPVLGLPRDGGRPPDNESLAKVSLVKCAGLGLPAQVRMRCRPRP